MNKIHSICTLALMLPLCAFAQYDGTPMNKTRHQESGNRRKNRQISSLGQRLENFDVLPHQPSAFCRHLHGLHHQRESSEERQESIGIFSVVERYLEVSVCSRSDQRPMDFFEKGHDVSGWGNIKVPANWEMKAMAILSM